jgi:hypothetical protein
MRSVVIKGGIPVFLARHEHEFLESVGESVYKADLNERQAEIAKVLTSRGVLQRHMDVDRGIYYTPNRNEGM